MVRDDEQPRAAHAELGGEGLARPIERDMIGVDATGVLYEFGAEGTATNRVRGTRAATGAQGQRDASICPERNATRMLAPNSPPSLPSSGGISKGSSADRRSLRWPGPSAPASRSRWWFRRRAARCRLDLFDGQHVGCFKISYNDGSQAFEFLCPACW